VSLTFENKMNTVLANITKIGKYLKNEPDLDVFEIIEDINEFEVYKLTQEFWIQTLQDDVLIQLMITMDLGLGVMENYWRRLDRMNRQERFNTENAWRLTHTESRSQCTASAAA